MKSDANFCSPRRRRASLFPSILSLSKLYLIILLAAHGTTAQQQLTSSSSALQSPLVRISALNVQCGDTSMTVDIQFSAPFQGVIFSKGYFSHYQCVYVHPGDSSTQYRFVIPYDGCGTTAGGTALNTDGRPAQFLRNLDNLAADASTMLEDKVPPPTETESTTTTTPVSERTTSGSISVVNGNRTRRAATSADEVVDKITITSAEDPPKIAASERTADDARFISSRQLPPDFGQSGVSPGFNGAGGDPNAREFINMHNMFNSDNGGGGEQQGGQIQQQPSFSNFGNPNDNFRQRQPGVNSNFFPPPVQQTRPPVALPTGFVYPPSSSGTQAAANLQQRQQPVQPDASQLTVQVQQSPQQQQALLSSAPAVAQAQQQVANNDVLQASASEFQPQQRQAAAVLLPKGTKFMENVLIIQFDANIQEVWDVAKALRCEWHDNYHKRVTYKPMSVGTLDVVEAAFAGDNIGVWMTVQQGQGPFAPEVNGIVRIGQQLTLTIGIQDPTKQFDMRVLNCIASDGTRPTIQLVDEYGCVVRPKIMAPFQKARNVGPQSSVVSYATFQAFKFPDSVDVNIECSVEVCKHGCPAQCFTGAPAATAAAAVGRQQRADDDVAELVASESQLNITVQHPATAVNFTRTKRETLSATDDSNNNQVGVTRKFKVVSINDMVPFFEALRAVNNMNSNNNNTENRKLLSETEANDDDVPRRKSLATSSKTNVLCISPSVFIASSILVTAALIVTVLVFVFLCTKFRRTAANGTDENRTYTKTT